MAVLLGSIEDKKYTKKQLEKAVQVVNNRYSKGLNDDDQVAKMIKIARSLKGYYVYSYYDTYVVLTDYEVLKNLSDKYGYWSDEVKRFNEVLKKKGGNDYMSELNNRVKHDK